MRLVIERDGERHEMDLGRWSATATLDDLLTTAGARPARPDESVFVDDHPHHGPDLMADLELLEGSVLSHAPTTRPAPATTWSVTVSGGLDAGEVLLVPAGRPVVVGRSPQADITVASPLASWNHLTIQLEADGLRVRDSGSTNGTMLHQPGLPGVACDEDGSLVEDTAVVLAGGASLLLRKSMDEALAPRPGSLNNLTPAATAPFNRPPRPGRPPAHEPVLPPAPKDIAPATRFSFILVLTPLIMAVAMVIMLRDARYAMFAALSPVMAVGSWFEQKQRRKKDQQEETKRFDAALAAFDDELHEAAHHEALARLDQTPDPATTLRRAALPTTTLWQRRGGSDDLLALHGGIGSLDWDPPVDNRSGQRFAPRVRQVIQDSRIEAGAVRVNLTDAGVVGIIGDRSAALAVARSLVCQAVTHVGPADLTVAVLCDHGREESWQWAGWLPHTRRLGATTGDRWLSHERGRSNELLRALRDGIETHPTPATVLVIDSDVLTEGRESPARALLGHGRPVPGNTPRPGELAPRQVSGIVIASTVEQLPAACTVVVRAQDDGEGSVTQPGDLTTVDDVVLAGIGVEAARDCALALSHLEDPELVVPGAALPSLVKMPPLLDLVDPDGPRILERWNSSRGVGTPVGVGENGTYALDLVKDGPHGLVGGTTGSGKSEFLRTLVAGLAANNPPTRLTFILMDFKGGAAFKTCERLPHTIGTVSNLDEQLADRALRALEAEMDYRQRLFAAAGEGVDNLDAYLATNPVTPLPRLLLVVDEFAMLAKDYPDVLQSLVSVAAVGRTLGVHMILATQRPAGVVNDDILANTNLRVALRVQSREDSSNVIGVPDAASIANAQKGRAYVKLGQDDITPVQTALVTGPVQQADQVAIEIHDLSFGIPVPGRGPRPVAKSKETDLDQLIDAIVAANQAAGHDAPRPVWPEPLDERVDLAGFGTTDAAPDEPAVPVTGGLRHDMVQFALSDDPDHQRQVPAGWEMDRGNLLLIGIPGYGTSTTLATIALTACADQAPDDLDLVVLDMGSRDLACLANLPHTAAYVGTGGNAHEQQARFLRFLRTELDRRQNDLTRRRRMVVLVDGLAALRDEFQDFEGLALLDGLYRAYAEGPTVGMHFAVATSRAKAIPLPIDEVTTQKWLFRLADHYDYASVGIRPKEAPSPVPGRCVPSETRLQTHVATPAHGLEAAVEQVIGQWPGQTKPSVVGQLPERISTSELPASAHITHEPWLVPVGLREADLEPQYLELYEGEHMLVAGPARSGRSSLLLAIAAQLRAASQADGLNLQIWGLGGRRSPLHAAPGLERVGMADDVPAIVAAARLRPDPLVLLIDDAEQFDDSDQSITGLLGTNLPNLHVIAAGRSDELRSLYSHWTKTLRKARCGVLLQPSVDYDGDLLGVTLPRKSPVLMSPGRGYACQAGSSALIQAVTPDV